MATRFHFHSTGSIASPSNPAFDSNWEQTGQATRLPMDVSTQDTTRTAFATSSAITIPITTTQQILAYSFTSNQIFRPIRLDASATVRLVINCAENATTNNAFIAYSLRAFTPDGGTLLATLASKVASGGTEYPLTASRATRITGATALTATTLSQPFRLVMDIGSHANAPTAAGSYTLRIGSPAGTADYAFTSALVTDLCTWFDLSVDLDATGDNNRKFPTSSGLSVASGWR